VLIVFLHACCQLSWFTTTASRQIRGRKLPQLVHRQLLTVVAASHLQLLCCSCCSVSLHMLPTTAAHHISTRQAYNRNTSATFAQAAAVLLH
jgi:uncharacterized membrane protein